LLNLFDFALNNILSAGIDGASNVLCSMFHLHKNRPSNEAANEPKHATERPAYGSSFGTKFTTCKIED